MAFLLRVSRALGEESSEAFLRTRICKGCWWSCALVVQALAVGGINQCVFVVWEGYSQEIPSSREDSCKGSFRNVWYQFSFLAFGVSLVCSSAAAILFIFVFLASSIFAVVAPRCSHSRQLEDCGLFTVWFVVPAAYIFYAWFSFRGSKMCISTEVSALALSFWIATPWGLGVLQNDPRWSLPAAGAVRG